MSAISTKSIGEFSSEDWDSLRTGIVELAKEKAFSKGLPIVTEIDGKVVYLYEDGRTEPYHSQLSAAE